MPVIVRFGLYILFLLTIPMELQAASPDKDCVAGASKEATLLPIKDALDFLIITHQRLSKGEYETTAEFKLRQGKVNSSSEQMLSTMLGAQDVVVRLPIDSHLTAYDADSGRLVLAAPFKIDEFKSDYIDTKSVYFIQTEYLQTDKVNDYALDSRRLFFDKYFLGIALPKNTAEALRGNIGVPMVPGTAMAYRNNLELLVYGRTATPYLLSSFKHVPVFNFSKSGAQVRNIVKAAVAMQKPLCVAIVSAAAVLRVF